ncbi:hypothetical protein [Metabacillus halosaccharovorans]|uniref:hypothetical protein n=1 Tax=Metabacillus halosaccharovorans TaxID=930124 RepID=UPI001C1FA44C|nr:hypothetical protein [Metabacillus halosaccharovorans]MBU7591428.1 hypothetical protein [Metabacillus halosaccharovorans]
MVAITERVAKVHQVGSHPKLALVTTMYREHQMTNGWMKDLLIDEGFIYGLSSGVGSLYLDRTENNQSHLLIGWNSLDPLLDLSMSTGTWVNRRFSADSNQAVEEMRQYLTQWQKPVLTPINCHILKGLPDPYEQYRHRLPFPISYCLVSDITDDKVSIFLSNQNDVINIPLPTFKTAIEGLTNQWVDLIFPKKELNHRWSMWQSFTRNVHHFNSGWRGLSSGLVGLYDFLENDTLNLSALEDTFLYATYLSGDLGRGWYAEYLRSMGEEFKDTRFFETSIIYEELSEAWTMAIYEMENANIHQGLLKGISSLEEKALNNLLDLANRNKKVRVG